MAEVAAKIPLNNPAKLPERRTFKYPSEDETFVRRLGSAVTIVQRGPRLLGREDADIADAVAAIMREDGIELLLDAEAVDAGGCPREDPRRGRQCLGPRIQYSATGGEARSVREAPSGAVELGSLDSLQPAAITRDQSAPRKADLDVEVEAVVLRAFENVAARAQEFR